MENKDDNNKEKKVMLTMKKSFAEEVLPLLPEDSKHLVDKCHEELLPLIQPPQKPTAWKGYVMHPGLNAETAKWSYENCTPRDGDVLVASYSKTGTTWTTAIVRNLLYHQDAELMTKSRGFNPLYNYLEYGPVCKYEVSEAVQLDRRCFGTHLPSYLVNLKKFKKIIWTIRNPKDQLVSWRNFMKANVYNFFPNDDKEFYDLHIAGKQGVLGRPGEGYLEHVKSWYQHKNDPNVMFLMYEDIKRDPAKQIKRIAQFIGVECSDETIEEIVQNTSFTAMKKAVEEIRESKDASRMYRKGEVGDWKNHLTVAQSERIDQKVEDVLGDTDIKFTYTLP